MQNSKERSQSERSSPHVITDKNSVSTNVNYVTPKIIQNLHGNGEYSGQLQKNYDNVDNINKKNEKERLIKTCNENKNQIVKTNKGFLRIHDLFAEDTELINSVHNFYNYVEPKYIKMSRNKEKHISVMHNNVTKPLGAANDNVEPLVTFKEGNNKNIESREPTSLTSREKVFADKSTYCRPVVSLYNEEFIHRTMERNSKLKKIVKSLAIARQREKENVSWNNYINELKNKHGLSCNYSRWTRKQQLEADQYITPDSIDDCYNTRFSWQQSNPCKHLLPDLYEEYYNPFVHTRMYTDRRSHDNIQSQSNCYSLPHNNQSYCYLTSSQGRLIALERERRKNNCFKYINNHENKNKNLPRNPNLRDIYSFKPNNDTNATHNCIKNAAKQRDLYFKENGSRNKATNKNESHVLIHEFIQAFESDNKIEEKHQGIRNNMTAVSLVNIETKISTLIDCINSFINEIKLERKLKQETNAVSVTCELADPNNMNTMKSDKVRTDNIVCGDESTLTVSNFYPCLVPKQSEIADLMKEIDKFCSKDRLCKSQPCSVNITFEVPTRDCCTEVTKSLSKQNLENKGEKIEEVSTETAPLPQMTIAVNTDPFNFLSLIKISLEALIHLFSNVPSINYQSYFAYLPFPQTTRRIESHYTCNICGAAFTKPSALSDHIQVHNLGKTRY